MKTKHLNQGGFSLVESVVATAILGIIGFVFAKSYTQNYSSMHKQGQKMEAWSLEKQFRDSAVSHISLMISNSIDPNTGRTCTVCKQSLNEWKIRGNDPTEECGPIKEKFKNSLLTSSQELKLSSNRLVLLDPKDFPGNGIASALAKFISPTEPRIQQAINRCKLNNYSKLTNLTAVRKLNFCFLILPANAEYTGFLEDNFAFGEIAVALTNIRTGTVRTCSQLNAHPPRERGIRGYYSLYYRGKTQPATEPTNIVDGAFYHRLNLENP